MKTLLPANHPDRGPAAATAAPSGQRERLYQDFGLTGSPGGARVRCSKTRLVITKQLKAWLETQAPAR